MNCEKVAVILSAIMYLMSETLLLIIPDCI